MNRSLVFILFTLSSWQLAFGWDYTGHMLVDQIAYENVTPRVRERVNALVALLENKHNANTPYTFITAGAWLDDMRATPNYAWGPWHYVDVAYTPSGVPFVEPPPPHALSAFDHSMEVLKTKDATDPQRAEALGVLMHLVGDLHQPLHCVDWSDRGGNSYLIYGIPFSDIGKKSIPNLHSFWDKAYRFELQNDQVVELYHGLWPTDRPTSTDTGLVHDQAQLITTQFPKSFFTPLHEEDARQWARESHLIACLFAYPARPHPTDAEVVTLTPDYVHRAHDIACSRVAVAGYRLAGVLESLFGK